MVNGHPSPNEIPTPFEAPGAVELRFTLAESAISVTITGVGASLSLIGDAVYVEDSPWQGGKIE